ncbi:MAG TPA: hypothetical protein VHF22_09385 [Planctomycetota bacterium]|nr:hypothetical protein [Planctomycetota bacterium]
MRKLAVLGIALAGLLAPRGPASAQTLQPGDKLVYETQASFGFEALPTPIHDPCTIETRIAIGVGKVDAKGMDVDLEIAVGVRAIRYRGPSFCWSLEPVTPDGFIGNPLSEREARELSSAVLPPDLPPLAAELVRKQLGLVSTIASLHGRHASARVSCGPEPFVRIEQLDLPAFTEAQSIMAERYLRTAVLLAFPPVPLDLGRDAERYQAGGSRYEVVGHRDTYWPIRGREHRVRSLEVSSAARAAFAFEAMNDAGLEPDRAPKASEWADLHARLGIAGNRYVRVVSELSKPGSLARPVSAVASWHADLVRVTRASDAPAVAPPIATILLQR